VEDQNQTLDIKRYLFIIYKKRYLAVLSAVCIMAIATVYAYVKPKVYEASSIVAIEKNYLNVLIRDAAGIPSVNDRVQALSVLMTSRKMIVRVLTDLGVSIDKLSAEEFAKLIRNFQNGTQIKFDPGRSDQGSMDIFTVTYRNVNPQFARDYVNQLLKFYMQENLAAKQKEAVGANRFIYEQLELYKDRIDKTEAELAQLKKDRAVQSTARLAALRKKYDELLVQYTEQHPEVIKVKEEIQALQERIGDQKRATRYGGGFDSAGDETRSAASGTGAKSIADLERNQDTYKKVYESLLASLGRSEVTAQVEVQAKSDSFNIVEPAILPALPVGPQRWKMILAGIFVGLASGIGVAILLDMMDKSIKSVSTLKGLGLPVIGIVPRIRNARTMAANRLKDRLLYGAAGAYVIGIATLAAIEFFK
jgi:succinoglycan biosynthesis transport protein ExoP